jgi:serine/threonine protein kinase
VLGWGVPYKVAVGICKALEYLHNGSPRSVIHRDVKSSNILLSHDFRRQLLPTFYTSYILYLKLGLAFKEPNDMGCL